MGYEIVRAVGTAATFVAATVSTAAMAQQLAPTATPAVAFVEDAEPALPAGGSPNFLPPARDAGGYITPNRNLSPEETVWHVRVALNVAALGCRGADGPEMVNGYNALLNTSKQVLAAASTGMGARYKARYGSAWQARHDDAMTKLYNFWALPPVQTQFCGTALAVLREAATVQPAAFQSFATAALPRLEAPMVAFFGEFETYIAAREAWRTRRARAMIAASVPATPADAQAQVAAVPAGTIQTAAVVTPAVVQPPVLVPVGVPVRAGAGEP